MLGSFCAIAAKVAPDEMPTSVPSSRADRRAIDRGNDGNFQLVQCQWNTLDSIAVVVAHSVGRAGEHTCPVSHVLDISARAERLAGTGKNHRFH